MDVLLRGVKKAIALTKLILRKTNYYFTVPLSVLRTAREKCNNSDDDERDSIASGGERLWSTETRQISDSHCDYAAKDSALSRFPYRCDEECGDK